jgi:two-component system, cell cycle response regulator DivK
MLEVKDVSKWKVLLVEDDPDNILLADQVLTFYGAEVTSASNGQKGLEHLANQVPTVILLDLAMPHMDGWEMLKKIRANPQTAPIPVIAVTAHAMQEDREKALSNGFDGYITKPYAIGSLIKEIQLCLAGLETARQNGAD